MTATGEPTGLKVMPPSIDMVTKMPEFMLAGGNASNDDMQVYQVPFQSEVTVGSKSLPKAVGMGALSNQVIPPSWL